MNYVNPGEIDAPIIAKYALAGDFDAQFEKFDARIEKFDAQFKVLYAQFEKFDALKGKQGVQFGVFYVASSEFYVRRNGFLEIFGAL